MSRQALVPVLLCAALFGSAIATMAQAATAAAETPEAAAAVDPKQLENPLPYAPDVLHAGRIHYLRHCQICHGVDGRALENIDFEASDLTAPSTWRYGTSDGEIFAATKNGAGEEMPPFASQLQDEEIWQVIHYVRSLGPDEYKPQAAAAKEERDGQEEAGEEQR